MVVREGADSGDSNGGPIFKPSASSDGGSRHPFDKNKSSAGQDISILMVFMNHAQQRSQHSLFFALAEHTCMPQ